MIIHINQCLIYFALVIFFCAIIRQSGDIFFLEGIFGDIFSLFQWMKSLDCYQFQGGIPLF
jgi:hypothetical protein